MVMVMNILVAGADEVFIYGGGAGVLIYGGADGI